MADIRTLRTELQAINAALRALHHSPEGELREFTPDMQKQFDDLVLKRDQKQTELDKHLDILEGAVNSNRVISPDGDKQSARDRWGANVNYKSAGRSWQVRDNADADELIGRAVDSLENVGAVDRAIESALDAMVEQSRHATEQNELARRIAVCSDPSYARAFAKLARDPMGGHNSFTVGERAAWDKMLEARAALTVGSTGTAMVPTHLDPTILLTNDGSSNVIRGLARVVNLSVGTVWNGISSDGVEASFDAEVTEVSDDTPTITDPSITAHKAQAFVQGSIEAFDDIPNLESEILRLFADAKDRLEETKFTVGAGDGSNEPYGVFTQVAATTASRVVSTTAAQIGVVDLQALYLGVPARHRRRSTWLTNPTYALDVKDLGTVVNASYSGDLREPAASRWYDLPVVESDDAPATQTTTALDPEIILGDFKAGFTVVDRKGATAEFIPHLFSTTSNRPDGRRGVYFHWRTGSDVVNSNAFRVLTDKTSA